MSLQYAILGLLTYKPMTGYELKSLIDKSVNFFWTAQQSQIYRELKALEVSGYVTSHVEPQEGRPDRKVYKITPNGDGVLQTWLEKFPNTLSSAVRDEISIRFFFGSRIPKDELKFQLKKFIREKEQTLAALNAINISDKSCGHDPERSDEADFHHIVVKRGLAVFKAEIEWAKESLKDLEAIANNR
jgi:PadR family transcriptional regulator AphA